MGKPPTNIVIIGGGTGGTLTANLLAKHLAKEISREEAKVYIVSGSTDHFFQPGYLDVAFKGKDPEKLSRKERDLVRREVHLFNESVERIDLQRQTVELQSGQRLSYDYVVMATGSVPDPGLITGLSEAALNFHTNGQESRKIWDALAQFDGGHIVLGIAGVPHKCPPSPNEAVFLIDDYLRKRGVRDKATVTFLTPYPRPYPAEPMSRVVEPRLRERGIELVTFFNVDSVDPARKKIYSLEGDMVPYDLLIMVPPHRGADVVIKSGIGDRDGWIPTDKYTMKVKGFDNAYAIGDTTDIPVSKTGVTAHLEAIVAARNIISSIRREGEIHRYNGRINCPFEMGSGRASFVIGTYDTPVKQVQPSRWRYAMKKLFGRFYWRTLSSNWDWLLNLYFGKTDIIETQQA